MNKYIERLLVTVGALLVSVLVLEETWRRLEPLLPFVLGLFVVFALVVIGTRIMKHRNW